MPFKDPAKRLEYQRNYERCLRADKSPEAEARRERRRAWWRTWHAKKWAEDGEFREYRRAVAREAQRRGTLKVARMRSAAALLAKAQARAAEALQARAKGYSGEIKPGRI
jgi:hypothetical protein